MPCSQWRSRNYIRPRARGEGGGEVWETVLLLGGGTCRKMVLPLDSCKFPVQIVQHLLLSLILAHHHWHLLPAKKRTRSCFSHAQLLVHACLQQGRRTSRRKSKLAAADDLQHSWIPAARHQNINKQAVCGYRRPHGPAAVEMLVHALQINSRSPIIRSRIAAPQAKALNIGK